MLRAIARPLLYAFSSAFLIGTSRPALAQNTRFERPLRSQIDAIVAPYVAANDFMGVVAVARDGDPPLLLPYGLASVELEVPHQASNVFLIGSVSKQFTAVAILLLEEEGLLSVGDAVSEYLPAFGHGDEITIEQLVTHTAGIADIFSLARMRESAGQGGTFAQLIDDLARMPLTHAPGSAYAYSNGGYAVLAAIIERVSGMSYGEYLRGRIFGPLGMRRTSHDGSGPVQQNRVPGYDPWGQRGLTPGTPIGAAFSTGSGSIWSSAADLLTWTAALHGGRVVNDSAYRKLTRDYGYGYGYGVSVFRRFGREVVGHDGRIGGYASDVARYLSDSLTVIILSNVQSVAKDEIRRLVAAAALQEHYEVPEPRAFLDRPIASLAEYVGAYAFGPGFTVTISEADGRLLARANEGGYSELVPVSETEWFSRTLYATVRVGRNESGLVDRLIWGRGEGAPVGRRVVARDVGLLQAALDSLTIGFGGTVGIYVRHLETGETAAMNADTVFPTASMVKVPILVATFDAIERGTLDFHQSLVYTDSLLYPGEDLVGALADSTEISLSKLALLMITTSDNTASLWLQALAGTGTAINEWLASHGFDSTRVNSRTPGREPNRETYGWGQTTPREMAELLVMIRNGKVVSPAASEEMYRHLTRSYYTGEALSALPPSVQAASKVGAVNRSRSEVVLVNAPSGDYVFCIITKEQADQSWEPSNEGWVLIRKVSALLWNHFEPDHQWQPADGVVKFKPE